MRSVLFALAFAGVAAAQLSPHVGDAWESPATEYCSHSEDPAGHKCYEGCATRPFKNKGLAQPGVCNPHLFNKVTSTKKVVQCSDGVTNVKYCAAPLYTVTVTQKTLGENAVEILAEASVPPITSIIKRVKPPCYYVGFYAECREETKAIDCVDSQGVKNIHGTCAAAGYTVCCDSDGRKTWFKPGEYPPGECGRFGEKCA